MNDLNLKGKWNQIKGKLKEEYSHLTDNDLTYVEGKEDELYGRLQDKLGKTKDDVKGMLNRFLTPSNETKNAAENLDNSAKDAARDANNMKRG